MTDIESKLLHGFDSTTEESTPVIDNSLTSMDISAAYTFPVLFPRKKKLAPDHSFFVHGNVERELLAKQVAVDVTADEIMELFPEEMQQPFFFCPFGGCHSKIATVAGFDAHYLARHMATCSVCSKQYPSTRLLNLHIAENHDSFFKAKVGRGYDMYECLVEGCSGKFQSDASRHRHLVDLHKFPKSFQFSRKKHLSRKQRKKTPLRQQATTVSPASVSKGQQQGPNCNANNDVTKGSRRARRAALQKTSLDNSALEGSSIQNAGTDIAEGVRDQDFHLNLPDSLPVTGCQNMETKEFSLQRRQETIQGNYETSMDIDVENLNSRLSSFSLANTDNLMVPTALSFGRRRTVGAVHAGRSSSCRKTKGLVDNGVDPMTTSSNPHH